MRQRINVINLKMTNSQNKVKASSHLHLLLTFSEFCLKLRVDEGGISIKNAFTLFGLFSILIMFHSHPSILQASFIYSGGFVCCAAISLTLNIARLVLSAAQTRCSTSHPCFLNVAPFCWLQHITRSVFRELVWQQEWERKRLKIGEELDGGGGKNSCQWS